MKRAPLIGFDVDGTLIDGFDRPRYDIIAIFLALKSLGNRMLIASGGGAEYALHMARRLGLDDDETITCSKTDLVGHSRPDIFFDDVEGCDIGRVNIRV